MKQDKYKIIKWYDGHHGYRESYSLLLWNSVYKRYTELKSALRIQFIYDYCLLNKIDNSKNFPIEEKRIKS